MDKLLFLLIVFATAIIPVIGSRVPQARRGLGLTLIAMAIATVIYTLVVLHVAVHYVDTQYHGE